MKSAFMGGSPFFCAAGPRCSSQLEQHRCWLRQRAVLLHSPGIPLARRLVGDRCRWWRAAQCFFDIRMGCEMCAPYQTPRACRTRMMFVFHPTCWRTTAELQPFMLNLPYFVRAVCHLDLARSGPGPRSTSASTPSSHRREQSPRTWYGPASSEGRAATMTSSFDTTSPSSLGHRHIIVEAAACLKGAVSPSGHRGGSVTAHANVSQPLSL